MPLWWQGWFVPHCARALVLGSSHPELVGGSFPFLTNQTFPQDASEAPVVAHWVPDPRGVGKPGLCAAGAQGWPTGCRVPRILDHNPRLWWWVPWPDTCVSAFDDEDGVVVPWCANQRGRGTPGEVVPVI